MKLPPWALLLVGLGVGLVLSRSCQPEPTPTFPTDRLDSVRVVTESIRVEVVRRDTVWRTRTVQILDSIPVVIAQVDTLACRPVIALLTSCGAALDSARVVADGWRLVAERDSAQATAERLRADSILTAWRRSRPSFLSRLLPSPSAGYGLTLVHGELRAAPFLGLTWRF